MEDKKEVVMQGRSFKHPVCFSNFVMPDGRMIVFNPAHGQNYGEHVTTDPQEIAELERAVKTTNGLIYEKKDGGRDEVNVPVKAEVAMSPAAQQTAISNASGAIEARRAAAQAAMRALGQAETSKASGNPTAGIGSSATVSGAAVNSNGSK